MTSNLYPLQSIFSEAPSQGALIDTFDRIHRKCRISLTDKCNLRCSYCMKEEVEFLPERFLLSAHEIYTTSQVLYKLGIRKIRLTGGEPLLRKDIVQIIKLLKTISGDIDISITTNGILLNRFADELFKTGIRSINISLDTLCDSQFRLLTKRAHLKEVLNGIKCAKLAGFSVKLNAVILKGINEDQIIPLAQFALENELELRFIESMPIGANSWNRNDLISAEYIIEALTTHFGPMKFEGSSNSSPSEAWRTAQGSLIGIIASVTKPFCHNCDRLRLTADGFLRSCLFSTDETDIKPILRPEPDLNSLETIIRSTVWKKNQGHQISSIKFIKPVRTMHKIGG